MSKCVLRPVLIFVCIVVLFFGGYVYGWGDGPCWDLNNGCGDFTVGQDTCEYDQELKCTGGCPWVVPKGAPDEYCAGLYGDCSENDVFCAYINKKKCLPKLFGPPHCDCEDNWSVDFYTRTGC